MFWRKTRWDQLFGEEYILRYNLPPILETDMDMRRLDCSKEVKVLFLWAQEHTKRQLSTDCRGLWGLSQQEHLIQQNNPLRTPSYGSVTPRGGTFYRIPEISGPQPFWHQGPISWRQFLHRRGRCFRDDSGTSHILCTLFLLLLHQFHPPQIIRH